MCGRTFGSIQMNVLTYCIHGSENPSRSSHQIDFYWSGRIFLPRKIKTVGAMQIYITLTQLCQESLFSSKCLVKKRKVSLQNRVDEATCHEPAHFHSLQSLHMFQPPCNQIEDYFWKSPNSLQSRQSVYLTHSSSEVT